MVLTILKHISQWEGLSHILWKIKNVPNHQPVIFCSWFDLIWSDFPTENRAVSLRTSSMTPPARLRVHLRSLLSSVEIFQVLTHHSWEVQKDGRGKAMGKKDPHSYCEWGLWWTMPINHWIWGVLRNHLSIFKESKMIPVMVIFTGNILIHQWMEWGVPQKIKQIRQSLLDLKKQI